jgi:hypothetical protein
MCELEMRRNFAPPVIAASDGITHFALTLSTPKVTHEVPAVVAADVVDPLIISENVPIDYEVRTVYLEELSGKSMLKAEFEVEQ